MTYSTKSNGVYQALTLMATLWLTGYTEMAMAKGVALVIGNSQYNTATDLNSPTLDANAMATKLRQLGFTLVEDKAHTNVGHKEMGRLMTVLKVALMNKSGTGSTAIFYFSGHGVSHNGDNWLIPVDDEYINYLQDLKYNAIGAKAVVEGLSSRSGGGSNVLFLDACRENSSLPSTDPTKNMRTKGLVRIESPAHTMIVYAAKEKTVAFDGGPGNLSPFTAALLEKIDQPGKTLKKTLKETAVAVKAATRHMRGGPQEPWVGAMQLDWNELVLNPCRQGDQHCGTGTTTGTTVIIPPPPPEHEKAFRVAQNTNTILAYYSVIKDFPGTSSATIAQQKIYGLEARHFRLPPVGRNHELGDAEIRWCLRQKIWLKEFREVASRNNQLIQKFKGLRNEFLNRCSDYSYADDAKRRAERWIDQHSRWIAANQPNW